MKQNSLCWYCKHVYTDDPCTWVDDGEPVEGWTIDSPHEITGSNITGPAWTATVLDCPNFERGSECIIFTEYLNKIADEIGIAYSTVHSDPKRSIQRYVEKTGAEVPRWVKEELRLCLEEKADKKA